MQSSAFTILACLNMKPYSLLNVQRAEAIHKIICLGLSPSSMIRSAMLTCLWITGENFLEDVV